MKIKLRIDRGALGGYNSDDDNDRFADAVYAAVAAEYHDADIDVRLSSQCESGCWASDDDIGIDEIDEIEERVNEIAGEIWNGADY